MTWWARKPTYPDKSSDDFVVLRDGLVVGRVRFEEEDVFERWSWSVLTMPAENDFADTMQEGLEKVRDLASYKWGHQPHGWPVEASPRPSPA